MNKQQETEKQRLYEMMVEAENAICAETPYITDSERIEKVAEVLMLHGAVMPICAIGDWVYVLWGIPTSERAIIYTAEVKEISIHSRLDGVRVMRYRVEPIENRGRWYQCWNEDVGKILFTSREEAEEALKKMQEARKDGNL